MLPCDSLDASPIPQGHRTSHSLTQKVARPISLETLLHTSRCWSTRNFSAISPSLKTPPSLAGNINRPRYPESANHNLRSPISFPCRNHGGASSTHLHLYHSSPPFFAFQPQSAPRSSSPSSTQPVQISPASQIHPLAPPLPSSSLEQPAQVGMCYAASYLMFVVGV